MEVKVAITELPGVGKTTPAKEELETQHTDYFCPHQGLTYDYGEGCVIGYKDDKKVVIELTTLQCKIFELLIRKQGVWCLWEELEEACFPPPKKWKWISIEEYGKKISKKDVVKDELFVRVPYEEKDRLLRVQKEVNRLQSKIRDVHDCKYLIVYKRNKQAYRLTPFTACSLFPDCR